MTHRRLLTRLLVPAVAGTALIASACAAPRATLAPPAAPGVTPAESAPVAMAADPAPAAAPAGRDEESAADSARAEPEVHRLYMTWNAPYGRPRATESIRVACGDTTRADTLYLCFDPGRDSPTFNGFTATLEFKPAPPDTLPLHWRFGKLGEVARHLRVLLAPDSSCGVPSPFRVEGFGRFGQDWSADKAKVRMIFAVAHLQATPVRAGEVYLLARILVSRPPRGDRACTQPLCVEWISGSLAYAMGDERFFEDGNRVVGVNAPVASACAAYMSAPGAQPWRPKPAPGGGAD